MGAPGGASVSRVDGPVQMPDAPTGEPVARSRDATTMALRWVICELMESALECDDPAFVDTKLVLCDALHAARRYVATGGDPVEWLERHRLGMPVGDSWTAMGRVWGRRLAERIASAAPAAWACSTCGAGAAATYSEPGEVARVCAGPAHHAHHERSTP